jgi:oligoendopeptidase F
MAHGSVPCYNLTEPKYPLEVSLMSELFPKTRDEFLVWSWPQIEPFYQALESRTLGSADLAEWLAGWSRLTEHVAELQSRLYVDTTLNTADEEAKNRFHRYLDEIYPAVQAAEQKLKEKLLASSLEPDGWAIPLRNMRTEAALFRTENLPLLSEEEKTSHQYAQVMSAQTVEWEGKELTISQMRTIYQDPDRARREKAWKSAAERQLADREKINELWGKLLGIRLQLAQNAGFGDDYRSFRWQQFLRFDYTPSNCKEFHQAILEEVVPVATRIYERRCQRLGLDSLRPWDLNVDVFNQPALRPFNDVEELEAKVSAIFHRVDPQLGAYFETMQAEQLLDLDNRKNKAPGAYCIDFPSVHRPFIFANSVGIHDDVQTVLHEGGHAFHTFENSRLPYYVQRTVPMEFAEVASMAMELLAAPYLPSDLGGFYSLAEAARARLEHLESLILFWPYMAVVDSFQQWVYENPELAKDPRQCDGQWAAQWRLYMPGVDWSGLEEAMATGWHRKLHIHEVPFYYVEYGLAQLGSVLIWRNALVDQSGAVADYRRALSLGGSVALPVLFQTAGAHFAFDAATMREAVQLLESTILSLEAQVS